MEEDVKIRIIAEDDTLTRSEQRRLQQASAHIPRYFRNIVSVEWHVSRQGRSRLVSCMVHSGSSYYRARVGSEVTEGAIGRALDKIVRQRRRRKAIRETARRHMPHDTA
jgi:ribosome-associated translation inhibitor RaiA